MDAVKKPLMIYIHIPFCIKKCLYCDFLSFGEAATEAMHKEWYIDALCHEIEYAEKIAGDRLVTSVFIGGGTPSVLPVKSIQRISDTLNDIFDISTECEFSIECNPNTVTKEKLAAYKKYGINRISLGLQSACNEDLKVLGRLHTYEDFLESYRLAREAGFANVNIDLMSAIPGQTAEKWRDNLNKVVALGPEHISAYSLIIEEGTTFYDIYSGSNGSYKAALPDEDEERSIYYLTKTELRKAGYERYEISNYSRPGYECRHNCGYWKRTDYLGFGLGAASLYEGYRFSNTADINSYISCLNNDTEAVKNNCDNIESYLRLCKSVNPDTIIKLSEVEKIEEFMFLGLRMSEGASGAEFKEKFNKDIYSVYGNVLDKLLNDKLILNNNGRWSLTDYGIDLSNRVLAEFLF